MATQFFPGQVLQRGDLDIYLVDGNQNPINAYEITYALYYVDPNTGQEVLIGAPQRVPVNPSMGQYYATLMVPPSATLGEYRIRWTIKQTAGSAAQTVVQSFEVIDQQSAAVQYSDVQKECIRKLRILLRDQCVGGEELVELDVDGELMVVRMDDLWETLYHVQE